MTTVRGNAFLVSGAKAAVDAEEGISAHLENHFAKAVDHKLEINAIEIKARIGMNYYDHQSFGLGPLSVRAWAYHERLVASRMLSYNSSELFWECQEH